MPSKLDSFDQAILRLLQLDARLPLAELASRVGLSSSPCWRRVQRLRAEGYIAREVVLLDADKMGLSNLIFVQVKLSAHGRKHLSEFTSAVKNVAEVLECHSLMGDYDFILRILVPDLKSYEQLFSDRLSALPGIQEMKSSPALSTIKSTTAMPVVYS